MEDGKRVRDERGDGLTLVVYLPHRGSSETAMFTRDALVGLDEGWRGWEGKEDVRGLADEDGYRV
jgi:hypothetical protein